MLVEHIKQFFQALTDNKEVVALAVKIQTQLEKGNTATEFAEHLDDKLISSDGSSGYIVQQGNLSGFRRFYNQEQNIASDFKNSQTKEIEQKQLAQAIQYACKILKIPQPQSDKNHDAQWQASLNSLKHSRYILSGGPGTGKTTTVIRIILLFNYLNPQGKIALAAPTGKAANRMLQSMNQLLPANHQQTAQTIHRLLGYNHQKNTLKYNQDHHLPHDLIIIDEASMLDVSLTYSLLRALKPRAQLLLIGDKNQLPAIEAGNVFADLSEICQDNYLELIHNYRFDKDSKIAQLCDSLIKQNLTQFKQIHVDENPETQPQKLTQLKQWYKNNGSETAIILSPVRYGDNSVAELNKLAIQILHKNKEYTENTPIIVNQNDYALGIFNGDIGQLKYIDKHWQVPFQIEGQQKNIKLAAIKNWQVAHAITIHKAQGSEYEHVLIAIPADNELELLTNSLLYTAISRAKKTVTIWASDKILTKIIKTQEKRITFLKK